MRGPRRLRLVLAVLVLTAFTLTLLDLHAGAGSPFDVLRRGSDTVFGPAQRAVAGAARSAGDLGLGGSAADVRRLQLRNAELSAQLRQTEDLRRRAADWDRLLHLVDAAAVATVPAHVTAAGASFGFESTATIDAGSRDGIRSGQAVVSGLGLVGRTRRVGPYTSTVVLVTDKAFSVGARLQRVPSFGFASGDGGRAMDYELIGQGAEVRRGDVLVTSGSDTFTPGLPVGRVTGIRSRASALTRTAGVVPFVDTGALDLVGVVVQPPRSAPRRALKPAATAGSGRTGAAGQATR